MDFDPPETVRPLLDKYERFVSEMAMWRQLGQQVYYPALGLAGESGEVVDRLKKLMRGTEGPREFREKARGDHDTLLELGDVLYYLTGLAQDLGFTLDQVIYHNMQKLTARKRAGRLAEAAS